MNMRGLWKKRLRPRVFGESENGGQDARRPQGTQCPWSAFPAPPPQRGDRRGEAICSSSPSEFLRRLTLERLSHG
jgi:hypothetical protein